MPSYGKQIAAIIIKYIKGEELNDDESVQLQQFLESDNNRRLFNFLTNKSDLEKQAKELGEVRDQIWRHVTDNNEYYSGIPVRTRKIKTKAIAIAATAILIAGSVYFLADRSSAKAVAVNNKIINSLKPEDIQPANNKTVLTLDDGSTVILDPAAEGPVTNEKGGSIAKLEDGELVYQSSADHPNLATIYNTVTTSKGGKQRIVLNDGTIIWLNATSSIKFPVEFSRSERKVFITGEAYFEVSHYTPIKGAGSVPFIVSLPDGNEVEVLGTHFNINSYSDEENVKVTLLEGKVKVLKSNGESTMLKPGQQAIFSDHSPLTTHHSPDLDQVMAWKNGLFNFKNAGIEVILREAARWYDIDVIYNGKPSEKFGGKISRQVNLGQLLMILKESDVAFEFKEGRKLIIYNKSVPDK
jgi:transmembrane sensor